MRLLDRRVVFVTGKGGVGKTVISALLALEGARMGKRVLLCESSGATRVPSLFRTVGRGYEITEVAGNVHTLSISSSAAIEDYLVQQLRFRKIYQLVFRNRVVGPFIEAVPGLHDLIQLGKVFDLERGRDPGWDLLVVDAPATGHGLAMLGSPRAMMELTVAGPFHENARDIATLFEDPLRTALVIVSLPEEMPLNETEDLWRRLGPMRELVAGVVLNEVHPPPLPDPALFRAHRATLEAGANDAAREALHFVDAALGREAAQAAARRRLRALGPPCVEVPFLFRRDLGPRDLELLRPAVASL